MDIVEEEAVDTFRYERHPQFQDLQGVKKRIFIGGFVKGEVFCFRSTFTFIFDMERVLPQQPTK